jgi:hypothetical protein
LVLSGALALAAMGALAVSAGILAVVVGVGSAAAGVPAVAVTAVSFTAGVVLIVAAGALAVAVTAVSFTAGVVLIVAVGALAVAVAQCSEIIFSPVTTTLLSEEPELVATVAFCAMTSTSWPRCGFRSTVLLVILKL